jgi:hypothetical protein
MEFGRIHIELGLRILIHLRGVVDAAQARPPGQGRGANRWERMCAAGRSVTGVINDCVFVIRGPGCRRIGIVIIWWHWTGGMERSSCVWGGKTVHRWDWIGSWVGRK